MPDQTSADPQRKITVTFKRKVNIEALGGPKYESAELFMAVDDYVSLDAEPADIVSTLRDLASTVKATLLDEMNLEWETTDQDVVIERLRNAFPGSVVQNAVASAPAAVAVAPQQATSSGVPAAPPYAGEKVPFSDKARTKEQRDWALARFLSLPDPTTEFWDNSESKPKPTSADWRHKEHGISLWQDAIDKARAA